MFSPVICDLDGTLVDSAPAIAGCLAATCEILGVDPPPDVSGSLRGAAPQLRALLATVLGGSASPTLLDEATRIYRRLYVEEWASRTKPFDRVLEVLTHWRSAGVSLLLVTIRTGEVADAILGASGLDEFFALRITNSTEATRGKEALLAEALSRSEPYGQAPIFIGDTEEDRQAASNLWIPYLHHSTKSWKGHEEWILRGHDPRDHFQLGAR